MPEKRKLAAILFADIVGYTSLMQKDEALANLLLDKFHNTLNTKVEKYNGQVINNYGDGCVCTFDSAVDAMHCAKEVQQVFQTAPNVPVRIGLHSGDVYFKDNNVYGDSVNIASRIESLGVEGAVLFSKQIKRHISNQKEFEVQALGEFDFKNVEKTMEIFALANEGLVIPKQIEIKGNLEKKSNQKNSFSKWIIWSAIILALLGISFFIVQNSNNNTSTNQDIEEKSIAVLPFENLSTSEENQFFADGMMEDILNNLSNVKQLKVISRTSSMKYRDSKKSIPEIAKELNVNHLLEGSVRRAGNQIKIVVQLIDAKKDAHIWSESYERELKDIFKIQSEVAEAITNTLKINLLPAEKAQINYAPTANMEAYDLYLRGRNSLQKHFNNRLYKNLEEAAQYFKSALNLEPQFALAKLGLARAYISSFSRGKLSEAYVDSALVITNEAIAQMPDLPEGYIILGNIERYKLNYETAVKHFSHAAELRPNDPEAIKTLASIYSMQEKYDEAIPLYLKVYEMEPNDVANIVILGSRFRTLEYYDEAVKYLKKAIEMAPDSRYPVSYLGTTYLRQNKFEEALVYYKKMLEINESDIWANFQVAETLVYTNKIEEAIPYFEKIFQIVNQEDFNESASQPPIRMRYAYALWKIGKKEKAQKLLDEAFEKYKRIIEEDKYQTWAGAFYDFAAINAFLGNKEKAYFYLNEAIEKKTWFDYRHALIDPMFESIRGEKEFQEMIDTKRKRRMEMRSNFEAKLPKILLD